MSKSQFKKEFDILSTQYTEMLGFREHFFKRYPIGLKRCGSCKEELGLSSFRLKSASNGLLRSSCAACSDIQARNRYLENADAVKARVYKNKLGTQQRNREYVRKKLLRCTCCICGGKYANENVLHPVSDGLRGSQAVHMAVNSGLSLAAVDRAFDCADIYCSLCYKEQKAREINAVWGQKKSVLANSPKTPHLYLFEKQMYRTYRRVSRETSMRAAPIHHKSKGNRQIPLTIYQAAYMLELAKYAKKKPIVLTGDFKVFKALSKQLLLNGRLIQKSTGSGVQTLASMVNLKHPVLSKKQRKLINSFRKTLDF